MLDEERYKAIREELQQSSPNSPQGFEILSRLAKIVGDKEMEQAAQELSKSPLGQFFRNRDLHRKLSKPPRS